MWLFVYKQRIYRIKAISLVVVGVRKKILLFNQMNFFLLIYSNFNKFAGIFYLYIYK